MALIVPYSAAWPLQAQALIEQLLPLFAGDAVQAEHIGSTAVPGLCAKPVLDLMLGVADLALLSARVPLLQQAGWRYRPEHEAAIPERRYFTRDAAGGLPRVHLHGLLWGGLLWRQHLAFRDALRERGELRDAYARLKGALAERVGEDKQAYQQGKDAFIAGWVRELLGERRS